MVVYLMVEMVDVDGGLLSIDFELLWCSTTDNKQMKKYLTVKIYGKSKLVNSV